MVSGEFCFDDRYGHQSELHMNERLGPRGFAINEWLKSNGISFLERHQRFGTSIVVSFLCFCRCSSLRCIISAAMPSGRSKLVVIGSRVRVRLPRELVSCH